MNTSSKGISRREMLKYIGLGAVGSALGSNVAFAQSVPESGTFRFQIESGPGTDFVAVVDAFIAEHPEITVEFSQVEAAVVGVDWQRIAMEAGAVDLISNENPKFLKLDPVLKAGLIQPLDGYRDLYEWDEWVLAAALRRSSRGGQLWTLPLYYEICGASYRKSVLESFDVGEPQSWEEFIAMLEKFKAAGLIPLTNGHRGFSQIQMIHYQFWASIGGLSGPGSITDVIFGDGKFTDAPSVEAAQAILDIYNAGLLDPDVLSITQDDGNERFISGAAALNVTGTWFYSEMQRQFDDDWDMLTMPGPGGGPIWCTGETEAMVIPAAAQDPDAAALFLDFCVKGAGAKILLERGNLLATKAFGELAIPQIQRLPIITGEESSLLIFGWLPQNSQDAYQQGLGGILAGSITPAQWAQQVQDAWERDIEDGQVPEDRSDLL